MWNSLRSDLKEFASTIASDGTTVLESIDAKLKESSSHENENECDDQYNALLAIDPEVAHTANKDSAGQDQDYDDDIMLEAQDEAFRRIEMEVTFLTPLLSTEINGVKSQQDKEAVESNSNDRGTPTIDADESKNTHETESFVDNVRGDEINHKSNSIDIIDETDDDSEDLKSIDDIYDGDDDVDDNSEDEQEIMLFLETFDIQTKTDDISQLLSQQPFLAQHFGNLVPIKVTYEQFWQRYYYRCDPLRIVKEWQEEDEQARLKRQELIGKGVKSVQNIFGGAFKAIKGVANQDTSHRFNMETPASSIYEKYQAELAEKQRAMLEPIQKSDNGNRNNQKGVFSGALGMFGVNGRPPFVLNTAESDDDEDEDSGENENKNDEEKGEEEDNLSWGSDDDEEEDEDNYEVQNHVMNETDQIVFEDKNKTTDCVIDEINNLKSMLEEAQTARHESEMRAQQLEEEFNKLNDKMSQYENVESIEESCNRTNVETNDVIATNKYLETIEELKSQLDIEKDLRKSAELQAQNALQDCEKYNEEMKSQKHELTNTLNERLMNMEHEHHTAIVVFKDEIDKLKSELKHSELQREEANLSLEELRLDLEKCKDDLKTQRLNFAKKLEDEIALLSREQMSPHSQSSSPSHQEGSFSSGEVIESSYQPNISSLKALDEEDDEDDGWGASWSDDE